MCRELHQLATQASAPKPGVTLNSYAPDRFYRIGKYKPKSLELFEAKIAQYPKGTRFIMSRTIHVAPTSCLSEEETKAIFAKQGMTLEPPAPVATRASVP